VEYNYPVVIHTRESFDVVIELLEAAPKLPKGIFHCFSGNAQQAERIIALGGFKLGIGGVITFKNSGLDKVLADIDLEHLVLETDAPYLAPVPFRGKRNEPVYLLEVAKKLAEVKNVPLSEVSRRTTMNAEYIFENS
jgi:TatD DNase family protein